MRDLPTGTITLLFTDIEGSTQLLQQLGDGYSELLTSCRELLRSVFQGQLGFEVDTQGDAIFAVFPAPAMGSPPRWLLNAPSPPIPGRKV